jgi:hypothetical protein
MRILLEELEEFLEEFLLEELDQLDLKLDHLAFGLVGRRKCTNKLRPFNSSVKGFLSSESI